MTAAYGKHSRDLQGVLELGDVVAVELGRMVDKLRRHGSTVEGARRERGCLGRGGGWKRDGGGLYLKLGRIRQIALWEGIKADQISRLAARLSSHLSLRPGSEL